MEQAKALNALEPFLALQKTATSPRAAADLVVRATSSPNTFIFAELLETPAIQSLAQSEFSSHLKLLQIFSYGTYQTYLSTPGLPPLNAAQTLKLRQLSLLTLARDRSNLTYDALAPALGLDDAMGLDSSRAVEDLVISAVYNGLVNATLNPERGAVEIHGVAPLRDLAPGAVPPMISALREWSQRCSSTLTDLNNRIAAIRDGAGVRQRETEEWNRLIERLTQSASMNAVSVATPVSGPAKKPAQRFPGKRGPGSMLEGVEAQDETAMEIDETDVTGAEKKRANRRKL